MTGFVVVLVNQRKRSRELASLLHPPRWSVLATSSTTVSQV